MKRLGLLVVSLAVLLVIPDNNTRAEAPETRRWLDFDAEAAALPSAENCTVARDKNASAGAACLLIRLPEKMEKVARVTFELPADFDITTMGSLQLDIRATPTEDALPLRWLAEDADGATLLQRRLSFDEGAVWTRYDLPLSLWRWGNTRVGDWAEVKRLTLVIEARVAEVRIDEMQWQTGNARPTAATYEEIAFGARRNKGTERAGFRIASDAPALKPEELDRLFERLGPILSWFKRVFGDAVLPLNDQPICVLIFAEREEYVKFAKRLGAALRVSITPPGADGYAIQDIATSFYDAELGVDRPVFFHEAVHATAARNLRLLPGSPSHSWLQEGIANYLQLCLFPESLAIETYPKLFEEGIGARTMFVPLKGLLTDRIEMKHYAQLAALIAWLAEKHNDWLALIARGLADGGDIEAALKECKTDFEAMQKDWLAWGQETFKEDAKRTTHFELPAEWKK
jgi:hypothetical protein